LPGIAAADTPFVAAGRDGKCYLPVGRALSNRGSTVPAWAIIVVIAAVLTMAGLVFSEISVRRQLKKRLEEIEKAEFPKIRLPGE